MAVVPKDEQDTPTVAPTEEQGKKPIDNHEVSLFRKTRAAIKIQRAARLKCKKSVL